VICPFDIHYKQISIRDPAHLKDPRWFISKNLSESYPIMTCSTDCSKYSHVIFISLTYANKVTMQPDSPGIKI